MSHRDELQIILNRIADLMEGNPSRSGNQVIGIASGGGTGISSTVNISGENSGQVVGVAGSVQIGSAGERETIASLRSTANEIGAGGGSKAALDALLGKVMKFGNHIVDYSLVAGAQELVNQVF